MSVRADSRSAAQKPAQRPAERPAQRPAERPAQRPAERPAQGRTQGPAQRPAVGGSGAAAAAKPAVRPREARQARFAQAFAQVVAVLMRDRNFRSMPLADLEWLVLPAVMSGQFRLGQVPSPLGRGKEGIGKEGGVLVPVAVALWARVSAEIDAALSRDLDKPVELKAHQWASGDHVWLVAVAGDRRAVPQLVEQLAKTALKGQRIKMRVQGADGKVVVKTLEEA
jgi:hemolysin-activating ACP:hemolysin acyltransferase